jgi:hypothetical protein
MLRAQSGFDIGQMVSSTALCARQSCGSGKLGSSLDAEFLVDMQRFNEAIDRRSQNRSRISVLRPSAGATYSWPSSGTICADH